MPPERCPARGMWRSSDPSTNPGTVAHVHAFANPDAAANPGAAAHIHAAANAHTATNAGAAAHIHTSANQTPLPTHTPLPTLEPLPTYTPLPTHTPQPTYTPFPTATQTNTQHLHPPPRRSAPQRQYPQVHPHRSAVQHLCHPPYHAVACII